MHAREATTRPAPPPTPTPASPTSRKLRAALEAMADARPAAAGARRGHRPDGRRVRPRGACSSSDVLVAAARATSRRCAWCSSTSPRRRRSQFVRAGRRPASPRPSPRITCCYNRNAHASRRRHAAALLLPAGAQARDAPRRRWSRRPPAATRNSSSAPTARRMPTATKESACGCAGMLHRRTPRSSCMPRPSRQAGALDRLEAFASFYGADFYGLPRNTRHGHAGAARRGRCPAELPFGDDTLVPLRAGETLAWKLIATAR
ncbi:MAG: hypothetical protein MZU95_10395 [Desulfomicrobium escambiense]|nr:hypothetical protein [Desulfomicrobium escambiense]